MELRVPKAELGGLGESMIERFGAVLEPVEATGNNAKVVEAALEFGARTSEWDAADESLKSFANIAVAMLTVLETLGPAERAVFVLREVFDVPYEEIAEAVGKSTAAVRQIAHRARRHVAARRPRMEVSRAVQQQVVERFLAALTTGDVQGLMEVLAPDVVMVADSGGIVPAVRHPVEGRERVVAILSRFPRSAPGAKVATLPLNGAIGARIDPTGEFDTAVTFVVEDGRIALIHAIRNPHKLSRLEEVAELRR